MEWATRLLVLLACSGFCMAHSPCYAGYAPQPAVSTIHKIYVPYGGTARGTFSTLEKRTFSRYGAPRSTPRKGHRHSGIDLAGSLGEKVYAIGPGRVVRHYWIFPNLALALEHRLPDGTVFYSAYVHLVDTQVQVGDLVDERTELGRLFNKKEMGRSRFRTPHLHLEIRKNFDDDGRASFTTMTAEKLANYFHDPLVFLRPFMN